MRYRLRTLLIVLPIGPPILAACVWLAVKWSKLGLPYSQMMFGY
jgi:hypothetical protein